MRALYKIIIVLVALAGIIGTYLYYRALPKDPLPAVGRMCIDVYEPVRAHDPNKWFSGREFSNSCYVPDGWVIDGPVKK